ncbi:D-alanyl-D-alanine carboxypeptidase [Alphaproteobacteria bacterium]|nr:D-alanyl-D-alanine carboxypeptidase [Alphaproteobacteria bacterium]
MKIKIILTLILMITPLKVYANFLKLNTPAKQVILYDHELNQVLFEKNAHDAMKPASMAKIMTAYIVFDRLQEGSLTLEDKFVVSKNAWKKGGSRTFLKLNSEVTISDLLMGLIVQSGNDAAIALAEGIAGSEEDFALQMNQYANSLEMKNTYFTNSTGWPHEALKTTAYDLIILTEALIKNFPKLYKLFVEKEFTFNNIKQPNRNPLLIGRYKVPGADGLKTGHTNESGYGLIGSVVRKNRRITLVINGLNSMRQRGKESKRLIELAFRETYLLNVFQGDHFLTTANVWLGDKSKINLMAEKPLKILVNRSSLRMIKTTISWNDPVKAPIKIGQKIGNINIKIPGRNTLEINLVSKDNVNGLGPIDKMKSAINYLIFGGDIN